ncbi:MAG: amidohydrolase family protein [Promethearchaeota archaeon]
MIINIHSHLIAKNMWSEKFFNSTIEVIAKAQNQPISAVEKIILPQISNVNAETYVKAMDEAGIDKGLVMGVDFGLSPAGEAKWSVEEMNHWVADQVNEYPDKLKALCAVDPRRGEKAIQLVEKAVTDWGMIGVKFHPTSGFYPDNPAFFPLYEKIVELDVPLHSHTSLYSVTMMSGKYADPMYMDGVAANFPDMKIVLIHFGAKEWLAKCVTLMSARPNVYAELSGQQSQARFFEKWFIENLSGVLNMSGIVSGAFKDRIFFGTDWPLLENVMESKRYIEWYKNLPEKAKEYNFRIRQRDIKRILGENAQKFLKL